MKSLKLRRIHNHYEKAFINHITLLSIPSIHTTTTIRYYENVEFLKKERKKGNFSVGIESS